MPDTGSGGGGGAAMGIGMGTQFLGSILQMVAARQAEAALGRTFEREQGRQNAHQQEAFGSFNGFLPSQGVEAARDALKAGSSYRMNALEQAGQQKFDHSKSTRTAQDNASYGLKGQARANLGAYSDWQLSSAIKRIREQDKLNRINYEAQQDAGVFPYRMFAAQHSGDDIAAAGSLIAAAGGNAASFSQFGQNPSTNSGLGRTQPTFGGDNSAPFGDY